MNKSSADDKKFYAFRISELFNMMMADQITNTMPDVLISTFDVFVKKCIDHFQLVDRNDYIQKEFESIEITREIEANELVPIEDINKKFYLKATNTFKRKSQKFIPIFPKERTYDLRDPNLQHKKNVHLCYEKSDNEIANPQNEIIKM